MARIKLELDQATWDRLAEAALAEHRPIDWHAEVMLRRALGMPFPTPRAGSPAPLAGTHTS